MTDRPIDHPEPTDDPARGFIATTRAVADGAGEEGLTVGEIVDQLDERAFGLLILLFVLPCLVPGLPGAQIIAIPIFLLGLQLLAGRGEPWLPGWFLRARVKKGWIKGIATFCEKRLRWTEQVARPRLRFLATGPAERLLPITNTIPSMAITAIALGLIQRDGLFTGAGAALALAWIAFLGTLVAAVIYGAGFAADFLRDYAPGVFEWFNRP
jgi:hypothetical protein